MLRHEEFYAFMRKREGIRLARAAGKPAPWTDDPILRKYSFTNVKREHDRTSRLLREEFYSPNSGDTKERILLNCATARYFGTIEMARAIGWQKSWNPERVRKIAQRRADAGERVFTGAYVITNAGIPGSKIDVVVDVFLTSLWEQRKEVVAAAKGDCWQPLVERLQQVYGFGGTGFQAKETILDTRYTTFWPPGG